MDNTALHDMETNNSTSTSAKKNSPSGPPKESGRRDRATDRKILGDDARGRGAVRRRSSIAIAPSSTAHDLKSFDRDNMEASSEERACSAESTEGERDEGNDLTAPACSQLVEWMKRGLTLPGFAPEEHWIEDHNEVL